MADFIPLDTREGMELYAALHAASEVRDIQNSPKWLALLVDHLDGALAGGVLVRGGRPVVALPGIRPAC